jgi:hypothetical protein
MVEMPFLNLEKLLFPNNSKTPDSKLKLKKKIINSASPQ